MSSTHPTGSPLSAGKLPSSLLAHLLAQLPTTDPQLLLGPAVGEDAAVIEWSETTDAQESAAPLLVAKSDPITFATDEIGYYAVHVCANDLAVTGARPRFYLPTILLPAERTDDTLAERIFAQIGTVCRQLGIVVAGGHSEITHTVNQPVVAGAMLGQVAREHVVSSSGCQPGDIVLLAGSVPPEGTSIIAREMRTHLLASGLGRAALREAAAYLYEPGISVLQPALAAAQAALVTAMHDPTEGGVITGLHELAMAADVGLEIDLNAIPITPLSQRLCAACGLDPLGVIASGALLATAPPNRADELLHTWGDADLSGVAIGRVLPGSQGLNATRGGQPVEFPHFDVDEITKIFS